LPTDRRLSARLVTFAALVAAGFAAALLMFGSFGETYSVSLTLDNAGQLVKGNVVKVGGVPVGEIEEIELADDRRARLELQIDDEELAPLHRGTVASVRSHSLSGIANRYLALAPGPNNRPEIRDGGEIAAEDAIPAVDLDQVLNTLDPQTQKELQTAVRQLGNAVDGHAREANEGLEALNPALSQASATTREVMRDEAAFRRFLVQSADVVSQVASRPDDLDQLTGNALGSLSALANRSEALDSSLVRLPPTLRRANTTLVNLRSTLREARPAVREARPAAPLLTAFLRRLRPVARRARPVIGDLRRTVRRRGRANDLLDALRGLPPLSREAIPAFRSADQTVRDALPVVQEARPYVPDLVGGLLNGFGGTTSGYYDANGHYVRIGFQASVFTLTGAGTLVELPELDGLAGYRKHRNRRCPGAAMQRLPDGSSPYLDRPGFPCRLEDTLR
jgi:phospholipid/cholesterol/gamma-HCH transport system substrate-binding protein